MDPQRRGSCSCSASRWTTSGATSGKKWPFTSPGLAFTREKTLPPGSPRFRCLVGLASAAYFWHEGRVFLDKKAHAFSNMVPSEVERSMCSLSSFHRLYCVVRALPWEIGSPGQRGYLSCCFLPAPAITKSKMGAHRTGVVRYRHGDLHPHGGDNVRRAGLELLSG